MSGSSNEVGVVIVTFNSKPEIVACVESVMAASSKPVSVVIVDNNSSDGTADAVSSHCPHVHLIRNSQNRYYAAASNQGIQFVGGEYILLLNPDTVLPVGGIDSMVRLLNENSQYAAVAPQLVGPDGRRQASLRELPGLDTLWFDLIGLSFLFPRSPLFGRWRMGYFDGQSPRDVQQPMASCLMIRRSAFAVVGLFDERFPMFFNDVDWCRRLHNTGGRILYVPDITVRHIGGASVNRAKVKMIWMSHLAYLGYLDRLYIRQPFSRCCVWVSGPFVIAAAILRSIWWGVVRRIFG